MSELYGARLLNGVLKLGKPIHVDGQIPVEGLLRIPGSGVQRHVPRERQHTNNPRGHAKLFYIVSRATTSLPSLVDNVSLEN